MKVLLSSESTAVGQVVAWAPVTQRARVRSPVGTSFLGEVFLGFSSPVRQMSAIIIIHNHSLQAPMT